jgi:hypothetical protein
LLLGDIAQVAALDVQGVLHVTIRSAQIGFIDQETPQIVIAAQPIGEVGDFSGIRAAGGEGLIAEFLLQRMQQPVNIVAIR